MDFGSIVLRYFKRESYTTMILNKIIRNDETANSARKETWN